MAGYCAAWLAHSGGGGAGGATVIRAGIIASNVDATVFAIESGAWRPSQARDMIRRLSQNARSLVGLVLTKFDARGVGYEYYYNESEYEYRPSTD